jgi:LmbE family N-acetylglucosaminyl deacetylase
MIAASAARGLRPRIIFTTDGAGSHANSRAFAAPRLAETRRDEAICAAAILGADLQDVHFLALPDTKAPHEGAAFDDAVARLVAIIADLGPVVIIAPWSADPHCDHLATHRMAMALAAACGARHLSYPVWGWTLAPDHHIEEMPVDGWRFPVSDYKTQREAALAAHRSQVSDLISDDPSGFRLDPATLAKMWSSHETFLTNP